MNAESLMILIKIAGGIFVVWVVYEFFIACVLEKGDEVDRPCCINGCGMCEGEGVCEDKHTQSALDVEEVNMPVPPDINLHRADICECSFCNWKRCTTKV